MTFGRCVLLLALVAQRSVNAQCPNGSPPPCDGRPTAALPPRLSVAVLSFDTRGIDSANSYLSEQLADEVTGSLARVERLTVKSRPTVRYHEMTHRGDPAAIGRALAVRFLVNGSLQRVGPRLRAQIQLIRADDGIVQWNRVFTGSADSLLDLQEQIARDVGREITGRLLPAESARLARRPTSSGGAYAHFLRGNAHVARRSVVSLAAAIDEYSAALRLDPHFTLALARVAYAYGLLDLLSSRSEHRGMTRERLLDSAFALATEAIRRDSLSAEGWIARGYLLTRISAGPGASELLYDTDAVHQSFRRAVELEPRNAEAWHRFAVSFPHDEGDAAIGASLRALSLEPVRVVTMADMGLRLLRDRRVAQATFWLDTALAIDSAFAPARVLRARASLMSRDTGRARADLARLPSSDIIAREWYGSVGHLRLLLSVQTGDTISARRQLAALLERDTAAADRAIAFAIVNDARALDYLEQMPVPSSRRGVASHKVLLNALWFDAFRRQPRFQILVDRLK